MTPQEASVAANKPDPDGADAPSVSSAVGGEAAVAAVPVKSSSKRRRAIRVESQAKKRLEAMANSVDHKLATAFTIILVLYAVVTFGTWLCLESQPYRSEVMDTIRFVTAEAVGEPRMEHLESNHDGSLSQNAGALADPADAVAVAIERSTIKAEDIKDVYTLQHTFPVHATGDMEFIDHPGIFLANKESMRKIIEKNPSIPADGKMSVPKFWSPTCYGPEGVRHFLGDYGQRLITPEEAAQIGSYSRDGLETIFISVASYRDPECQPTVEDIFLRADHPDRLRVAVVDQRAEHDSVPPCGQPVVPCEEDQSQVMCRYAHLIDVYDVPAILSVGPVFARHLANRLYRGEYYAMQVDSHVRFIEHWDTNLLDQWKSAKNEMGVISTYLSDITDSIDPVTHANTHPGRPIMCKTDYEGDGKLKHLRHGQQPEGPPGIHGEPTLHPFWAAGFSFARGHFVVQVPYDQYEPMVFQGEEIFMGLRGFTYGYDYYTAETSVAFHMYAIKKNKEKRKKVKLFWENSNLYPGSAVQGMKRLNGIIGMGDVGETFYDADERTYGLGQVRPKEKFYKLYGIHTDTKKVEDHLCQFVGKPMHAMFKPYLRENRMGIDFSKIDFEYKDPDAGKKTPPRMVTKAAAK